jgi:hypothetical protein
MEIFRNIQKAFKDLSKRAENELATPQPQTEKQTPEPEFILTGEGASAFPVDDPLVRLVFNYGSYMPGSETYYGTPDQAMAAFIEAVKTAAKDHPELVLQYAAWQRDPVLGKGNRSQPPWVIAILAGIEECIWYPRFEELVAKCVVRPDDALNIVQAATNYLGDNRLPPQLKEGLAQGLARTSDYQLAKYANARLNLLPEKRQSKSNRKPLPPAPVSDGSETALAKVEPAPPAGERTLRLVDVLGICKDYIDPRLFALYRYLHAPTRQRAALIPLLEEHLPLLLLQKNLRETPPRQISEVESWVKRALEARMTMEQIFAATGLLPGQRQHLALLSGNSPNLLPEPAKTAEAENQPQTEAASPEDRQLVVSELQQAEVMQRRIRAELWRVLSVARVPDEENSGKSVAFLGDMAFFRNLRGMYEAGLPLETLIAEARLRQFKGLWPFQVLSAARAIRTGKQRGKGHNAYVAAPRPEVIPAFVPVFERTALALLPRREDGTPFPILGMADISGSMGVQIGSPNSGATCMDAAVAFSVAFSYSLRTRTYEGLAGSWSDDFFPVERKHGESPLDLAEKVSLSGGWGGTQVFGSVLSLIEWLDKRQDVPRPEVLVFLSDMQFHPPADQFTDRQLKKLPERYRKLLQKPEFRQMPPLAAAIVLYREVLGHNVSVVIWNLAFYRGSPAPSGMERVLLMSGFDANSFRIIEQWLRAGSPGTAMPQNSGPDAASGQSESSFQAVLHALRKY